MVNPVLLSFKEILPQIGFQSVENRNCHCSHLLFPIMASFSISLWLARLLCHYDWHGFGRGKAVRIENDGGMPVAELMLWRSAVVKCNMVKEYLYEFKD